MFFKTLRDTLRPGLFLAILAVVFTSASARPTIGLLLKIREQKGFWAAVEQGAKEAADTAQVDLIIDAGNDPSNFKDQILQLNALVNQKIDALVIMPSNPNVVRTHLKTHAANGLKIVVAETDMSEELKLPYVGYDQEKIAFTTVNAMSGLLRENDEVALFRGVKDSVILKRDKAIIAQLKAMKLKLQLHVDSYAVDDEFGNVRHQAELMLKNYPNSKIFIASYTLSTAELLAAAKTVDHANTIKLCVIGATLNPDTIQGLENGMLQFFVAQAPKEIGCKSVAAAVALIQGKTIPQKTILEAIVVTKENLNDPAIQALKTDQ